MYINQAELENYLKRDLTTEEAGAFTILAGAAKEVIDNYCDTNFDANVTETSRYYDGGTNEVVIDPCTNVTAVARVSDDGSIISTIDEDDYVLEPINNTVKWSVRARVGRFIRGARNLKVTAKFSSYDNAVPSDVKLACMKLCADALKPSGVKKESIEGYSYEFRDIVERDEEITNALAKYRRVFI